MIRGRNEDLKDGKDFEENQILRTTPNFQEGEKFQGARTRGRGAH